MRCEQNDAFVGVFDPILVCAVLKGLIFFYFDLYSCQEIIEFGNLKRWWSPLTIIVLFKACFGMNFSTRKGELVCIDGSFGTRS